MATMKKTGMSASRTKPIALGIVHGFSGAPASVIGGGGPERSSPKKPSEGQPRLLPRRRRSLYGSVSHSFRTSSTGSVTGTVACSCPRRSWTS